MAKKQIKSPSQSLVSGFVKNNIHVHLFISFVLHLILILFSELQDRLLDVKYTDIDYTIFTDGARYTLSGQSPFDRATYRYTPILAWMVTPNIFWFPQFGKILFSILDLVSGMLIYAILPNNINRKIYTFLWLYNPLPLIISTRGSCESVICTLVILVIYLFVRKQYYLSGLAYGFVIHFKIYPIIYAATFYLALSKGNFWSKIFPNKSRFSFFIPTFFGLTIPTLVSYYLYGTIYIDEAWLYHFYRQDLQHNFSPYFYLYQLTTDEYIRKIFALSAFIPQLIIIILSSFYYNFGNNKLQNICMSLFIQTFIFVNLNKVITAQYFEWYMCLLPLVVPFLKISSNEWLKIIVIWTVSILQWLLPAYFYEFRKWNCLDWVGLASITFVLINLFLLAFVHKRFVYKLKTK